MININVSLTDGRVLLRPYEKRDAAETYKAIRESIKEMSPWLPFAHPDYSPDESRDWIKRRPGEWKHGYCYEFIILDAKDGACLGGMGINRIDYDNGLANLGYWVRSTRTGQGVAPAAARLLAGWGFKTLRLNRIEIIVAVENMRSQRVAEKLGAQREGILRNRLLLHGKPHDAVSFSLVPGDFSNPRE
jgi:ribosomal-protein-serine acetyltransferase